MGQSRHFSSTDYFRPGNGHRQGRGQTAFVWNGTFSPAERFISSEKSGGWFHERNYLFGWADCSHRRDPFVFWLEVSQRAKGRKQLSLKAVWR